MLTSVLPLALGGIWRRFQGAETTELIISKDNRAGATQISLAGAATASQTSKAIAAFREAIGQGGHLTINISKLRMIDARFFGFLLMVRKQIQERGGSVEIYGPIATR